MYLLILFGIFTLCGLVLAQIYEHFFSVIQDNRYGVRIDGYHLHHSLFGISAYTLSIASLNFSDLTSIILAAAGTGIIIQHTISEKKLTFIHKVQKQQKII